MKKKFILLPITLTALAQTISLVGCGNPDIPEEHKVKVDSSSDTTDINISTPEITLKQELVIPYKIINQEKELDVDNSWLKFDLSNPLPLSEFSYDNNQVVISADKVTTYDITICLKSKTPIVPTIELDKELVNLEAEQTTQLTATVTPKDEYKVAWSSLDESVATVDQNGLVTAVSGGDTQIKATIEGFSDVFATCACNVIDKKEYITKDTEWSEDYIYKTQTKDKLEAAYRVDIANFEGGETVRASIIDAKDPSGQTINYLEIVDGTETVIKPEDTYLDFKVRSSRDRIYDTLGYYTFSVKFSFNISGVDLSTTITDFKLDVVKPTESSMFNIDGGGVLSGFIEGSGYEDCDILLIPDGVTSIADNAFYDTALQRTKIPLLMRYMVLDSTLGTGTSSLKTIGDNAFRASNFRSECYIPSSVQSIGNATFESSAFTKLYFGLNGQTSSLKTIGNEAFRNSSVMGDCILPEGLISVGDNAFRNCGFNKSYIIPKSLETIGQYAFAYNKAVRRVGITIPKDSRLTTIGTSAFYQTHVGGELYIPDSCTTIGSYAFNLTNITSISFPVGLTISGTPKSFKDCNYVNKIDFSRISDENYSLFKNSSTEYLSCGTLSIVKNINIILQSQFKDKPGFEDSFKQILIADGVPEEKIVFQYI